MRSEGGTTPPGTPPSGEPTREDEEEDKAITGQKGWKDTERRASIRGECKLYRDPSLHRRTSPHIQQGTLAAETATGRKVSQEYNKYFTNYEV